MSAAIRCSPSRRSRWVRSNHSHASRRDCRLGLVVAGRSRFDRPAEPVRSACPVRRLPGLILPSLLQYRPSGRVLAFPPGCKCAPAASMWLQDIRPRWPERGRNAIRLGRSDRVLESDHPSVCGAPNGRSPCWFETENRARRNAVPVVGPASDTVQAECQVTFLRSGPRFAATCHQCLARWRIVAVRWPVRPAAVVGTGLVLRK